MKNCCQWIDIGANLLDERFTLGIYRGTFRHAPDLEHVIQRAAQNGVTHIVITAGTVTESRAAVQLARHWNQQQSDIHFHSTVGVHPTRCQQVFEDERAEGTTATDLLNELLEIARDGQSDGTVCAIGEIGLDYDRLEFCPKDMQQEYLQRQLQTLAKPTKLPLFLHNRSVGTDLYDILKDHQDCWFDQGGVVHSFDDTLELARKFIDDLNVYIGLNGCSLRTPENLATARALPLNRILLETDSPYCEIRSTHAGYSYIQTHFDAKAEKKYEPGKCVKNRQEPCHIVQVAQVLAGCKQVPLEEVARTCHDNTLQLYGWHK